MFQTLGRLWALLSFVLLVLVASHAPANAQNYSIGGQMVSPLKCLQMPCMGPQENVATYRITPDEPRLISQHARRDAEGKFQPLCLKRTEEADETFEFGRTDPRVNANVLLQLEFYAPDQPPRVKRLYDTSRGAYYSHVAEYVQTYRMPCVAAGGQPVVIEQLFPLRTNGRRKARVETGAFLLSNFLSAFKSTKTLPAHFDTAKMNCPFQVIWTLGQPATTNEVTELDLPDPSRVELLKWLEAIDPQVGERKFEALMGVQLLVHVPCPGDELAAGGDAPTATPEAKR